MGHKVRGHRSQIRGQFTKKKKKFRRSTLR
uniref:Uncharacterized protein n=1 Tax=Anguilla anguilla TaxID=7936 RepID=A0A0E9VG87_ANGAN